jgi:hypothetical protein
MTSKFLGCCLFGASTAEDRATCDDPTQHPAGSPYAIVNGVLVIDGGKHTGVLPGRVLARRNT